MEQEFDQYIFENILIEEFFGGPDLSTIGEEINDRLKSDEDFRNQFNLWLEESGYENWQEFYKLIKDEEEAILDSMYPDGED